MSPEPLVYRDVELPRQSTGRHPVLSHRVDNQLDTSVVSSSLECSPAFKQEQESFGTATSYLKVSPISTITSDKQSHDFDATRSNAEIASVKEELAQLKAELRTKDVELKQVREEEQRWQGEYVRAVMALPVEISGRDRIIAEREVELERVQVERDTWEGGFRALQQLNAGLSSREEVVLLERKSLKQALEESTIAGKKREEGFAQERKSSKRALEESRDQHAATKVTLRMQYNALVQRSAKSSNQSREIEDASQATIENLQRENEQLKVSDAKSHAYNVDVHHRLLACQTALNTERAKRQSARDLEPQRCHAPRSNIGPDEQLSAVVPATTGIGRLAEEDEPLAQAPAGRDIVLRQILETIGATLVQERAVRQEMGDASRKVLQALKEALQSQAQLLREKAVIALTLEARSEELGLSTAENQRVEGELHRMSATIKGVEAEMIRVQEGWRKDLGVAIALRQENQTLRFELETCKNKKSQDRQEARKTEVANLGWVGSERQLAIMEKELESLRTTHGRQRDDCGPLLDKVVPLQFDLADKTGTEAPAHYPSADSQREAASPLPYAWSRGEVRDRYPVVPQRSHPYRKPWVLSSESGAWAAPRMTITSPPSPCPIAADVLRDLSRHPKPLDESVPPTAGQHLFVRHSSSRFHASLLSDADETESIGQPSPLCHRMKARP